MYKLLKNKLFYPIFAILTFLVISILAILSLNKVALSNDKNFNNVYPGTIWIMNDELIGGSKAFNLTNHNSEIKFVDFSKEIIIPELPPLPEIPLTEEDK